MAVGAWTVAENSHFIAGRAFYQNGANWVDTQVQKQNQARRLRIQFNSSEYFASAAKNKTLAPMLSLGANVEFFHDNEVIEIHE